MEKYSLSFSKSVKSDHNQNFWYFPNNHIETTKIFSVRSSPDPAKIGFSLDPCSSLIDTIAIGNPERHVPKASHQCCPGSGFLESDPADLWDFFGSGDGLDIIFAQTGSGSGLSKTVWTLFNFFVFCFFSAKILLITWELWCWMMRFILFFNLSRMVDFHTAVVRWRESYVLQSPLAMAIAYTVRHVSKVGVLFAPRKKPTFQKLSNVSMCIQSVAGWDWASQH